MFYNLCIAFSLFFIYSVIGYFLELISVNIHSDKLVLSRGYLLGPYLPIFGFGSLIMSYYLSNYENDFFALFFMGIFYCWILEYITSYLLEKLFKLRWWDYSDRKYNLNGRICLETGILFGIGSIVVVKVINPFILKVILSIPNTIFIYICIFLFIIMFIDFILSTFTIIRLKIDTSKIDSKDSTNYIKEEVRKSLEKYRFFHKRLFNSFPNLKLNNNMYDIIKKYIYKK